MTSRPKAGHDPSGRDRCELAIRLVFAGCQAGSFVELEPPLGDAMEDHQATLLIYNGHFQFST
jgi:hypothetical protein